MLKLNYKMKRITIAKGDVKYIEIINARLAIVQTSIAQIETDEIEL